LRCMCAGEGLLTRFRQRFLLVFVEARACALMRDYDCPNR